MISEELYRNILLATVCVFATTWLLLFNLTASLLVLGCVVLTLVNVGGFIHFWGLTIDTVSCTNIIISIGLCVDYSVHIAHAFLTNQGSRNERVRNALTEIGPAVFNGGFSTFLAFILLAGSKSHVFQVFFKVLSTDDKNQYRPISIKLLRCFFLSCCLDFTTACLCCRWF